MNYDKTVKDVAQYTGLDYHYILKCVRELPDVFTAEIAERGDNNSLLFNSNAISIFDRIKQMKEGNQSLKSMRLFFQNTFNQNDKSPIKSIENENQNELTKVLLEKLDEANKQAFNAFKETIKTKDDQIRTLESKILLLTDGKEPQVVKAEYEKKQEDLIQLQYSLKDKERQIEEQMKRESENLKARDEEVREIKNLVEHKDQELLKTKNTLERQQELLKELAKIEGKWFVTKKRQELLIQLQELA